MGQNVGGTTDSPAHAFAGEWFHIPSRITQHQNPSLCESSSLTRQLTHALPLDVLKSSRVITGLTADSSHSSLGALILDRLS